MQNKTPLLTISLLISNRPDTIPRCLDSLKLIMDVLPCELILIDTSKNAEIHQMLFKYTDKVYEFEWCQDFAKARNEGVKRAKGEWFLYLDDDEWLVEVDDILKFFQTGEYKKYGSANVQIRNFMNPEYTEYADGWVTRLFQLDGETRFEGKVHEYIYHLSEEQAFLPAMVHHTGYIYETEEKKRQHFERNARILLEIIKDEPHNLRWQAQMVQEYCAVKEWENIVSFCKEYMGKDKELENFMDRNHFCTLYAGLVEALMNLKRDEEFFAMCDKVMEDERSTELLKSLMYIRRAERYVELEEWDKAKEAIETYLERYKQFDSEAESSREQLGSLLVHRTFEKDYVDIAYNILIYTELKKGNIDALDECGEDLELSQTNASFGRKYISFLVELMATREYREVYGRLIENAVEDEALCHLMCAEAQQWEEKDEVAFQKIAHIYAQTDSKFWYICYCRVVDADIQKDKKLVETALEELLETLTNVFYLPDRVYEIIDKYKIKVAWLWDQVAADNWQAHISQFVLSCGDEYINKVSHLLNDVYKNDDWHIESLELAIMEKQIMMGPQVQVVDYYDLLRDYANKKIRFYNSRGSEQEELPQEVQAATKIKEYVELETQDKLQALNKLKEAVDICPAFADGIGNFFHLYSELERYRASVQKNEMINLRNQIFLQVQEMISAGQGTTALQIIQQMKQMFPDDLEVVQLALEVRLKTLE